MTTALLVWADERKRVGILKTQILRAIREWVGHCENCDTAENLTVHHNGKHWLFDIVVFCEECHIGWHWLTDPKRKIKVQKLVKGNCPKCDAKLGVYVQATTIGIAIVEIDKSWHKVVCPRCGTELECRAKPQVVSNDIKSG